MVLIVGLHVLALLTRWNLYQESPHTDRTLSTAVTISIDVTPPPKPVVKSRLSKKKPAVASSALPDVDTQTVEDGTVRTARPEMQSTITEPALQLSLPRGGLVFVPKDNPARFALEDPRSNTPKPTNGERLDMALGNYSCVFTERLADGTIFRGPGILDTAPAQNPFNPETVGAPKRGSIQVCRRKHS